MATAHGSYKPNVFADGALREAIERLASGWGGTTNNIEVIAHYSYGSASDEKVVALEETESINGIISPLDRLHISYSNRVNDISHYAALRRHFESVFESVVDVTISADDIISAQNLLNQVASTLNLTQFDSNELRFSDEALEEDLKELESRVTALERTAVHPQLKCFLSFRFSKPSSFVAQEIEQFLTLLGVKVVSGLDYEPRKVEDKVRDRLLSGVDFVVYLVTSEGESSWLRDELATATAQGAIPIPLVEEGCNLAEGMHGNIEYITFAPGHPGDAWIRLAQAVRYVAEAKLSNIEKQQSIDNGDDKTN